VLTLTFLVGAFQLVLGLARMGALVNFISHTVVIGFTAGAAILIAASQVRNFFGIQIPRGTPFYEIVHQLVVQAGDIDPWVAGVGVVTLVTGILARRYVRKIPYMIVAMIVGSIVAEILNLWMGQDATGIETVGALPAQLPPLSLPDFSLNTLRHTIGPALVITMLGLTEAVSIARAIAVRSEQRIDGNQEFIGQGLSNMVGAFFSAYASSGSFNRSGVNYEAGARTPLASVFASIFLLLVLLIVAPLAAFLPNAAMAGILFLVAWGLIDFHHIRHIWRTSKIESAILAATLIGTLFNLEAGIFLGVFLSLVMYLYRSSKPEIVPLVPAPEEGAYHFVRAKGRPECPQLRIVRINGAVYFGAASYVQQALQQIDEDNPQQKSVLIAAASLNTIDIAGAEVLAQEARRRRRLGGGLYFYRLHKSNYDFLSQGGYVHEIGEGAFFPVMTDVTKALYWTLDPNVCRTCKTKIFKQCHEGLLPDGDRRIRLMLVADQSDMAEYPRQLAMALAKDLGITLDVVGVAADRAAQESLAGEMKAIETSAIAVDVPCELILRLGGDLASEVHAAAKAANTQLLVLGRRVKPGVVAELGPATKRIVGGAPCHVLVVPSGATLWHKSILVAFDGSDESLAACELAAQLAKPGRLPIILFSVTGRKEHLPEAIVESAHLAIASLKLDGIVAEHRIGGGGIADGIDAAARETGADLIMLYRHTRGGLSRTLLGSVGDQLIQRAEVPVLLMGDVTQSAAGTVG